MTNLEALNRLYYTTYSSDIPRRYAYDQLRRFLLKGDNMTKGFVIRLGTAYVIYNGNETSVRKLFCRYSKHFRDNVGIYYGEWNDRGFEYLKFYRWSNGYVVERELSTNTIKTEKDFVIGE